MRRSLGVIVAAFLGGAAVHLAFQAMSPAIAQQPQTPPDVIRARQFVLVDSGGRERARLQVPDKGTTGLVVLNDDGKPVAEVGILPEKFPGLKVNDGVYETTHGGGMGIVSLSGKLRFGLGFTEDGGGGLTFKDEEGRERMGIGMPAHGGYSLFIQDEKGQRVWNAPQ